MEDLLFCADKYKTDLLASLCRTSLVTFISTSLVCKVMEIAQRFSDSEIIDICLKKVDEEIPKFLFTEEFLSMCPACIYKIFQRDSISAPEELIFDQVVKWSKEECSRQNILDTEENQRKVLGGILKEIRFPIMEHRYLSDVVCESGILKDDEKVDILRQQLQAKNTRPCQFKKKERTWKPTKLMISSLHSTDVSENLYDSNSIVGLTLTAHCKVVLVGIYLNIESFPETNKTTVKNVIVNLVPQEDRITDKFVVPLSECITDKYIKLYPRFLVQLYGNRKYTVSIGFECTTTIKKMSYSANYIIIKQKTVTNSNLHNLSFNGQTLSVGPRNGRSDKQIISGFCLT